LLSALETIHAQQLFHRDIAPDNIIIRPNGKPVLIDFGAARHFARENSHTLGAIVKSGYSPPEQYTLDTKLQGAWSDVYALAATMHHAVTGHPPEEASKRQLHDTVLPLEEHLDPALMSRYRPQFIAGLDAGLALKPKERPATIGEWRPMLMDTGAAPTPPAAAQTPPRAAPAVATPRPSTTADPVTQPRLLQEAAHEESGDGLTLAVQLLALAAAALGGVGFFWFGGIAHMGSWVSAAVFIAGLAAYVLTSLVDFRSRSRGLNLGQPEARLPNTAAAAALALAAFWLPPFVLPTYYLSAALFALAVLAWLVPDSRLLAGGLVIACLAHLLLALWLLTVQPFGANKFVILLGAGLAVLAALSAWAAGMWVRRANALRQHGAHT
jgi:hypothetical protein